MLCVSAPWLPRDRPVGPIILGVCAYLCVSLEQERERERESERERCVFGLADMVDMLPAIVTQRRPGITERASVAFVPIAVKQSHMTGVMFQTLVTGQLLTLLRGFCFIIYHLNVRTHYVHY